MAPAPSWRRVRGPGRPRALVAREFLGFEDDRARALFLHGSPDERVKVECGDAFKPLEIWGWGAEEARRYFIFYRPRPGANWRLWIPSDSKRALYTPEMEYWL